MQHSAHVLGLTLACLLPLLMATQTKVTVWQVIYVKWGEARDAAWRKESAVSLSTYLGHPESAWGNLELIKASNEPHCTVQTHGSLALWNNGQATPEVHLFCTAWEWTPASWFLREWGTQTGVRNSSFQERKISSRSYSCFSDYLAFPS